MIKILVKLMLWAAPLVALAGEPQSVWLADLDLAKMSSGWGHAVANHSVTTQELAIAGQKLLKERGTKYFSELAASSHPRDSYHGGRPKKVKDASCAV